MHKFSMSITTQNFSTLH